MAHAETILLVDDTRSDALLYSALLQRTPGTARTVDHAPSLEAALRMLQATHYTAVMLDLGLPDSQDLQGVRLIVKHHPELPVVVLTGQDDCNMGERAIAAGAQDYLHKGDARVDTIDRVLRHAQARQRQENQTREVLQELRALFDHNPMPVFAYDEQTLGFVNANAAALAFYGYPREEFLRLSIADIRVAEEPDTPAHEPPGPSEQSNRSEWRHRTGDGRIATVQVHDERIRLQGRDCRIVIVQDVTAQRSAQRRLAESERRYREVFEHSLGFICTHGLDGTVQSINPAAAEGLGRTPQSIVGHSLRDFMPEPEQVHFSAYLQRILEHGQDHGLMPTVHRNGEVRLLRYHNRLLERGEDGPVVLAIAHDVTREHESEAARRRGDQRLATLADALPLLLMFLDRELRVEFINSGWSEELRRPPEQILGRPVLEVLTEPAASHFAQGLTIARDGEEHSIDFDDPDETAIRTWNAVFIPQRDQAGQVDGVHVMLRDVTLEKAHRQELVRRAEQDPLTGTLNRAGFQVHGSHAWNEAARQGRALGMFFFDLDGFKEINDTLGHAAGDGLLQEVAARVSDCLRSGDIVARMGGDEFAVIASHLTGGDAAKRLSDRLLEAVRASVHQLSPGAGAPTLRASCSLGYYVADTRHVPMDEALKRADAALYAAKRAGKGQAVQWSG